MSSTFVLHELKTREAPFLTTDGRRGITQAHMSPCGIRKMKLTLVAGYRPFTFEGTDISSVIVYYHVLRMWCTIMQLIIATRHARAGGRLGVDVVF